MRVAASTGTEPRTCESCGRGSVLGHFDWWGRCPVCRGFVPPIGGIVYTVLLLAVAMAVGSDIEPGGKLAAVLAIWPIGLVNTVLHESAHAIFAILLGWRVHVVTIGAGTPLVQLRLGATRLVLNRDFLSTNGQCRAFPERFVPSRRTIALYVAAPLVAHGVAAAAALRWVSGDSLGGVLAALFAASNVSFILWSAWPRDIPRRGGTDGQALLDLWRDPEAELAKWRLAVALGPHEADMRDGRTDEALKWAEEALALEPGNDMVAGYIAAVAHASGRSERALPHVAAYARAIEWGRSRELRKLPDRDLAARGLFRGRELDEYMRASLLVALDRLDEVLAISERGVEAATTDETRALWQGCVALALLMMERDLDRAEAAARWAYERLPWVPFVETAWGMVRIERGERAAGLDLFELTARIDPEGRTRTLRSAWAFAARMAMGLHAREIPAELRAPGVWPACRRRAERALAR